MSEYKTLSDKVRAMGAHLGQFAQLVQEVEGGMRVLEDATRGLEARLASQNEIEKKIAPLEATVGHLERRKAELEAGIAEFLAKFGR